MLPLLSQRGIGIRSCLCLLLRQTEIENLGVTALGDENVGRLDVAMNDSFGVSGIQCIGNLDGQIEQNIRLDGLSRDAMLQREAIQKFHGDERLPVLFADFVDGADVGMIQGGCGLRFALEAAQGLRVVRNFIRQELQGNKAVELCVLGLVNHTHTPATEFFDDAVVRDGLAD